MAHRRSLIRNGKVEAIRDGFVGRRQSSGRAGDRPARPLRAARPDRLPRAPRQRPRRPGRPAREPHECRRPTSPTRPRSTPARRLAAGFTTVRNLGDGDGVTLALRDAIARGQGVRARASSMRATRISTTSGHMDGTLGLSRGAARHMRDQENLCDGAEACRRAVRLQIRRGVDVIKIATTGGVNSRIGAGLGQQMFDDEAKASDRDRAPLRQEGRRARARRRRHQPGAARRRRLDRARHAARRREHQAVPQDRAPTTCRPCRR